MSKIPDHVATWWMQRLAGLPKGRREVAARGVDGLTPADWEAFYELHTRWRIAERTPEELAELEREENRILRGQPRINRFGVFYGPFWSWGLRAQAARRLWGDVDLSQARFEAL